jgi:hypothetical protein
MCVHLSISIPRALFAGMGEDAYLAFAGSASAEKMDRRASEPSVVEPSGSGFRK